MNCLKRRSTRLEALDWHYKKSSRYYSSGKPETALTRRHFGMRRYQFYRWKNRYDPKRLTSLEPGSTAPKKKRKPDIFGEKDTPHSVENYG